MTKGTSDTLIFEYEGAIQSADDSPVPGLKLAYIGDPITYLLYAGRWFPMVGYGINRFTSTISVSVPAGYTVIGSGKQSSRSVPDISVDARAARKPARRAHSFTAKLTPPAGYKTVHLHLRRAAKLPGHHSDWKV